MLHDALLDDVGTVWPEWFQRSRLAAFPESAGCSQRTGPATGAGSLRLCPSHALQLAYLTVEKAASTLIRTTMIERYAGAHGLTCPLYAQLQRELNISHNASWAWFTFVRDPIERFMSGVAEVARRRMPHPPLMRVGADSWGFNRTAQAVMRNSRRVYTEVLLKNSRNRPAEAQRLLSDDLGLPLVASPLYYPSNATERLAMVLWLVTRGGWDDIHFRTQWATVRGAARALPTLVARGFIGSLTNVSAFFSRVDALHARSDSTKFAKVGVGLGYISSNRRRSAEVWPDDEQRRQLLAHYRLDYECLRL